VTALDPHRLDPVPQRPGDAAAHRLADDLWCLQLPVGFRQIGAVNAYLVGGADGWLLVDCGTDLATLEAGLAAAAVPRADVRALVLTHTHSDHGALASDLITATGWPLLRGRGPHAPTDATRNPNVPPGERRRRALREGVPERDLELITGRLTAGHGGERPAVPDRILEPGDALPGARNWRVVPIPGHSVNQIALFDTRTRRLIAADLAYPTAPQFVEWGYTPDPVREQFDSLERAAALGATLLLPGHGRPDSAPRHRLVAARRALAELVERTATALADGALTAYEVGTRLSHDDADPDRRQSSFSVSLAILEHLAAAGRVEARDAGSLRCFQIAVMPASTTRSVPLM
jgi:glyoxylase-like metal-dependent hydrolase (beta-lactamase superfamily II)